MVPSIFGLIYTRRVFKRIFTKNYRGFFLFKSRRRKAPEPERECVPLGHRSDSGGARWGTGFFCRAMHDKKLGGARAEAGYKD